MTRASKKTSRKKPSPSFSIEKEVKPFIEHLHELRRRLFYVALSVGAWSTAAYFVQQHITNALLRPAKGQKFIYTSPGGGIDFLFRECLYTGIALSIPVIVYQVLRYLEPLLRKESRRFIALGSIVSGVLAVAGMACGYFLGLPAALNFLLHQFTTAQIKPLVTIQSYIAFVTVYMLGSALMFQVPLILVFINRIKPLQPRRLLHFERWVILGAFVMSGLMNPTPNIFDQLFIAGPIIVMYQLGIAIIYFSNRPKKLSHFEKLLQQDAAEQAARQQRVADAKLIWQEAVAAGDAPLGPVITPPQPIIPTPPAPTPAPQPKPHRPAPSPRGHLYINDFMPRTRRS